ncbi:S9 family peptidase [Prauserella cavernicola]|uniref:S9 family peptidase n=1 Tax=Prauserella cavernicola TaxID=2800127 RepID=A0A934V891_9PSEU|nr:S9 family peptidase [Prauserella cavernicola]MBK1787498.1 S9 family peptidase [Prauserella cavernicola]
MALPKAIDIEDFFAPAQRTRATISPDGTTIAYLAPWKNRLNVWVRSVDSDSDARCVTADDHRGVGGYHWTDDPRWLLYIQDNDGDENWHLFRVDLEDPDAEIVDLTPVAGARVFDVTLPASRPGTAIIHFNNRRLDEIDLLELDIATGELTLLAENPGRVNAWLYVDENRLYTQRMTPDGTLELSRWDSERGELSTVATMDGDDYPTGVYPFELTDDGTGVWVGSTTGTDRTRLARIDLTTGEETEVDSHPVLDIDPRPQIFPALPSSLIRRGGTGALLGVRYLGERQVIRPLDAQFAEVLEKLETLSDGDLAGVSSDESGRRWVVSFTHDRDPDVTWFYDHATGEARILFRPYPHLDPEDMAPMTPVTITARDGLPLPSYLTLPVGVEPSGLPMVLMPHGGPWTRDAWGFNKIVQSLANLGYAVLQVNFRGSTGFGKAHMKAAIGEFAGRMNDDLVDAVEWAGQQGYADRERVAIFGGSYGGYASLVGISFTPDVFAAAVDYVGISNLATFMESLPPFVRDSLVNNFHAYVGDPGIPEQREEMVARSPISRVDDIRTPLLVLQGANDVRVVQAESDNLVAALRDRGVEVEYIVFEDEGHLFANPENLVTMMRATERFLATHLGSPRQRS